MATDYPVFPLFFPSYDPDLSLSFFFFWLCPPRFSPALPPFSPEVLSERKG